jgi:hypothetical protein
MLTTTDHDPIDFTFEDDGDLVRRAPKAVPEDPVEKRLERERKANEYRKEYYQTAQGQTFHRWVEVKHGSGKVKV